jgi:hypothetical protein
MSSEPISSEPISSEPAAQASGEQPAAQASGQDQAADLADWTRKLDEKSKRFYYVNKKTKERSWKPPAGYMYDFFFFF